MAIQFKGSNISGVVPDMSELAEREIGINTADGKLFTNDGSGIIEIDASKTNTGLELINGVVSWRLVGQNVGQSIGVSAIELCTDNPSTGAIGNFSIAIGDKATALNTRDIAIGNDVAVGSPDSLSIGYDNVVGSTNSSGNIVIGIHNTATNSNPSNNNTIIYGNNNDISGFNSIAVGYNNTNGSSTNENSVLFGVGLSGGDKKTVIGMYNDTTAIPNSVFEVGAGNLAGTKTVFGINNDGVAIVPTATPANITNAGAYAIVTSGYLADPATLGVSKVNNQTGEVFLYTNDVPTSNDKLYISQSKLDLIDTNASNISTLDSTKQDNIIYGNAGQIMTTNGASDGYNWIDFSILNNIDVVGTMGSAGQYMRVNTAGTQIIFEDMTATVIGLDKVENMSPLELATSEFLPDGTTRNPIDQRFDGLDENKINAPGVPDTDQVGAVLQVESTNGVDTYTTRWTDFTFYELGDVTQYVPTTDDGKFLRLATPLVNGSPAVVYDNIDLSYTASPTDGSVDINSGTSAVIPLADGTNAGLLAPADFTKLSYITVTGNVDLDNVVSDTLSYGTAGQVLATNASGDGYVWGTIPNTDLSYTASPTDGKVTSSTGTDATLPLADSTNAGLLSPVGFDKLGYISVTQAVDLDTMETDIATNATNIANNTTAINTKAEKITYTSLTSNGMASANNYYFADTSGGAITLTLPNGNAGDVVYVLDVANSFATNNLTVAVQTGDSIMGVTDGTVTLSTGNEEAKMIYAGSDWRVIEY